MFQFNIVFGILIAYLSNALLSGGGEQAWRWMLYFAPRIFAMSGLGAEAALLQSIGIGVTNLIFTFARLRMA